MESQLFLHILRLTTLFLRLVCHIMPLNLRSLWQQRIFQKKRKSLFCNLLACLKFDNSPQVWVTKRLNKQQFSQVLPSRRFTKLLSLNKDLSLPWLLTLHLSQHCTKQLQTIFSVQLYFHQSTYMAWVFRKQRDTRYLTLHYKSYDIT